MQLWRVLILWSMYSDSAETSRLGVLLSVVNLSHNYIAARDMQLLPGLVCDCKLELYLFVCF